MTVHNNDKRKKRVSLFRSCFRLKWLVLEAAKEEMSELCGLCVCVNPDACALMFLNSLYMSAEHLFSVTLSRTLRMSLWSVLKNIPRNYWGLLPHFQIMERMGASGQQCSFGVMLSAAHTLNGMYFIQMPLLIHRTCQSFCNYCF